MKYFSITFCDCVINVTATNIMTAYDIAAYHKAYLVNQTELTKMYNCEICGHN